jgi:hypothetical protein
MLGGPIRDDAEKKIQIEALMNDLVEILDTPRFGVDGAVGIIRIILAFGDIAGFGRAVGAVARWIIKHIRMTLSEPKVNLDAQLPFLRVGYDFLCHFMPKRNLVNLISSCRELGRDYLNFPDSRIRVFSIRVIYTARFFEDGDLAAQILDMFLRDSDDVQRSAGEFVLALSRFNYDRFVTLSSEIESVVVEKLNTGHDDSFLLGLAVAIGISVPSSDSLNYRDFLSASPDIFAQVLSLVVSPSFSSDTSMAHARSVVQLFTLDFTQMLARQEMDISDLLPLHSAIEVLSRSHELNQILPEHLHAQFRINCDLCANLVTHES